MEDLRKLSFFELQSRIETAEANIKTILAELKAAQDELAAVEQPVFEVGKCYRRRDGSIAGPLEKNTDRFSASHPLRFQNHSYRPDGYEAPHGAIDAEQWMDILPGAVDPPPAWTPPKSLPDGEYRFSDDAMYKVGGGVCLGGTAAAMRIYNDWIDPPREGRWKVTNGTATYLGDA